MGPWPHRPAPQAFPLIYSFFFAFVYAGLCCGYEARLYSEGGGGGGDSHT